MGGLYGTYHLLREPGNSIESWNVRIPRWEIGGDISMVATSIRSQLQNYAKANGSPLKWPQQPVVGGWVVGCGKGPGVMSFRCVCSCYPQLKWELVGAISTELVRVPVFCQIGISLIKLATRGWWPSLKLTVLPLKMDEDGRWSGFDFGVKTPTVVSGSVVSVLFAWIFFCLRM